MNARHPDVAESCSAPESVHGDRRTTLTVAVRGTIIVGCAGGWADVLRHMMAPAYDVRMMPRAAVCRGLEQRGSFFAVSRFHRVQPLLLGSLGG